jgi:cytochrome c oxidase subunit III
MMSTTQLSLNSQIEAVERQAQRMKSSIAMTVFLVSLAMMFATLILSFVVFRLSSTSWPPMGMDRPTLFYPLISSFFIIASSFAFEVYAGALKKGDFELSKLSYWLTVLLGLAFLVAQVMLWNNLTSEGYLVDTGVFASMLHSFTWVHAAHIVMGLIWLLYLLPTTKLGATFERYEIRVSCAGKFWHFLGIVWVLLFVILFVV